MHSGAFATTFGLIFLAELPDKTAYTVLLLASRGRPLLVLLGLGCLPRAGLGGGGAGLGDRAAASGGDPLDDGGALFRLRALPPPRQGRRGNAAAPVEAQDPVRSLCPGLLAELGDATQIGTAALVARLHDRWSVLAGSTLALWSVSALAVTLGATVGARLPKRILRRIAGGVFVAFAAVSFLAL